MATIYDPGHRGDIRSCGNGQFEVESFREPGNFYLADLREQKCSCPDHSRRTRFCKHLQAARAESFRLALRTAAGLSTSDLYRELSRPGRRPEVREAIAAVIERRAERLIDGGEF